MRARQWLCIGCFACGCGRINFDDQTAIGDALANGDALTSRCSPWSSTTRFDVRGQVVELAYGGIDLQPQLSSDRLTIYFASGRSGDFEIFTADRVAIGQPFMNIRPLSEVNSPQFDTAFALTLDQRTAYIASLRAGVSELYVSQRSSATQPFSTPTLVPASTAFADLDPFPSADGLRLYWAIQDWDQGMGGTDLVVATRTSTAAPFGPPTLLAGLSTAVDDDSPAETADGRTLVFASARDGINAIYYATRATTADAYGQPDLIGEIRISGVDDFEPYVTPDGCELWFTSDRQDGNQEIFFASVTP